MADEALADASVWNRLRPGTEASTVSIDPRLQPAAVAVNPVAGAGRVLCQRTSPISTTIRQFVTNESQHSGGIHHSQQLVAVTAVVGPGQPGAGRHLRRQELLCGTCEQNSQPEVRIEHGEVEIRTMSQVDHGPPHIARPHRHLPRMNLLNLLGGQTIVQHDRPTSSAAYRH